MSLFVYLFSVVYNSHIVFSTAKVFVPFLIVLFVHFCSSLYIFNYLHEQKNMVVFHRNFQSSKPRGISNCTTSQKVVLKSLVVLINTDKLLLLLKVISFCCGAPGVECSKE